jgi:putative membrane protein
VSQPVPVDPSSPKAAGAGGVVVIGVVSVAACAALLGIVYGKPHGVAPAWVDALPWVNASMNALCATLLVLGVRAVRRGDRVLHAQLQRAAFAASTVFLFSYVTYHWVHGDTKYVGPARGLYLAILASHILLSIVALPLVLTTFFFALTQRFALHRKLARVTFPIWLYVSVTGVVIVLMLKTLST